MRYSEMRKLLIERGYQFLRFGKGSHEIWKAINGSARTILVSRSGLVDQRSKENWIHRLQKIK